MKNFTKFLMIPVIFLVIGLFNQVVAQCENTTDFGSATVDHDGAVISISTCTYTDEYSSVNGLLTGYKYEFKCTLSGTHKYITLRDAGTGGNVLAHGTSPLVWTATYDGTVYAHWTDDAACNSTASCHTTTVQYVACENSSAYGSATVDPDGEVTEISNCSYTSEYSTVNGIVSDNDYEFTCTLSGTHKYVTIRDDAGTLLATGPSPLTWTATVDGTVYPHWTDDATCASTSSCHITTVQCLVACRAPTDLVASNITTSSVDLDWTEEASSTTWEYDYGMEGYGGPAGAGTSTTTKPISLSGLTSATTYDWYVRADCGGGSHSEWAMSSFTTACGANTTFPWAEDFEGAFLPECWSVNLPGGSSPNNITQSSTQNHTVDGTYSARFSSYSSSSDYNQYLFSPAHTIDANHSNFSFWHRKYNTALELLEWGISTTTNPDDYTWTEVTLSSTDWQETVVDLSSYFGQTVYIGFHYYGNYLYYVYLDDISLKASLTCYTPAELNETGITETGATLSWTSAESFFDVYIVPIGDPAPHSGSTPTADDVSNPYTWSGGTTSTTYDWYVRADCAAGGGTGQSEWSNVSTFTTACDPISSFPVTETFVTYETMPGCWFNDEEESWLFSTDAAYGAASAGDHTGGGGTQYAWIDGSEEVNTNELFTPLYDPGGLTAPRLNFWHFSNNTDNPNDNNTLYCDMSIDGGGWTMIFSYAGSDPDWQHAIIDLSAYSITSTVQFKFYVEGTASIEYFNDILLDDITIEEASTTTLSWYNYQFFNYTTIKADENVTAYAQCWEPGVTEAAGPGAGIECWIGYSTSNTDPATWTDWIPASYNYGVDPHNNDEYGAELGVAQRLDPGIYYVASRFVYLGGPFTYGGYNSGAWNGFTNVSGILTVLPCNITTVPYFENFDDVTSPYFPLCMTVENTNADAYEWITKTDNALSVPNCARIRYNSSLAMDDWFFTKGLALIGGVTYEVAFSYSGASDFWLENLEVDWGIDAVSTAMSGTPIFYQEDIGQEWSAGAGTITPATTGIYYVGFHGFSDVDQYYLYVDDISVVPRITTTTWTGIVDNNWQDPGNWTSGIPTSGSDVTIPAGLTNYPTVESTSLCASVHIESGASLIDNGLLYTVSTTVERDYSGEQWHFIGPPVTGETANTFYGLYLQTHDEVSNTYSYIVDEATPLMPGQGYALWNYDDATASYSGLLTNSITKELYRTAPGNENGWNLIANPFPSSVDWEAPLGWKKLNVDASTYCFDGAGSGNWAVWNGTTGTNGATQYIASGQGFFVAVNDAEITGALEFNNEVRVHHNTTFFKEEPADIVKLMVSGNNYTDETVIYFRDEATEGYDGQMDAHKIPSFHPDAPYIYSTANEGMAINVLPEINTVPVNVKIENETGIFTIETVSNGEYEDLYLEDLSTGTITDLNASSYTFEYIPGIESRFLVHFDALAVNDNDQFSIHSYDKYVYVATPENTSGTITIYDIMGREIVNTPITGTLNIIKLEESAYYVVKVISYENILTKKVFVK